MSKLKDGFKTLISFASAPSIEICEITVKPPGFDGGGEIDQTCMENVAFRTFAPKSLKTLTEASATVSYDPLATNDIEALINQNDEITITYPDGITTVFFGWLNTWEPSDLEEGERPTVDMGIMISNVDLAGNEQGPVTS